MVNTVASKPRQSFNTLLIAVSALILACIALVRIPSPTSTTSFATATLEHSRLPASGNYLVEITGRVDFEVPTHVHGYVFVTTQVGELQFRHVVDTMLLEHDPQSLHFRHTFFTIRPNSHKVVHTIDSSIPITNAKVNDTNLTVVPLH